jgi:alpha-1,3/alpha-1,6-mannosyltransferase
MLICAIWVLIFGGHYDYYILDQVSLPVPLLRLRQRNVLFYCHYPDKLLSTDRRSLLKRFYRFFLDLIEEITTGLSKCIVVNSLFTQRVFLNSFPLIRKVWGYHPEVVYPSIDIKSFVKTPGFKVSIHELLGGRQVTDRTVILTSLNRYERKKNIPLALEAFAAYMNGDFKKAQNGIDPILVIAGGYDPRLSENVEVH